MLIDFVERGVRLIRRGRRGWLGPLNVIENSAIRLFGLAGGRLILLGMTVVMAQRLGVDEFGRYSFITAYLAFFRLVGGLGLSAVLAKEFSRASRKDWARLMATALGLNTCLMLIAIAAACSAIRLLHPQPSLTLATIVASLSLVAVLGNAHVALFQAERRLQLVTLGEIVQLATWGVLATGLLIAGAGMLAVLWSLVVSIVLQLAIYVAFGWGSVSLRVSLDAGLAWRLLKVALPVSLVGTFGLILGRLDVVMLHIMRTDQEVGWYGAAIKLSEPWLLIVTTFTAAVFPELCIWYRDRADLFTRACRVSYKYLLSFILPVAVGGTLLADQIVVLVYGRAYAPASTAFAILLWALVFLFLETFSTYLLLAADKPWWDTFFTVSAGIVNVILNIVLIPRFGFVGAAVASASAYLSSWILQGIVPATRMFSVWLLLESPKSLVAAFVMGLFLALPLQRHLVPCLLVGPPIYVGVLWLLGGLRLSELRLFVDGGRGTAPARQI